MDLREVGALVTGGAHRVGKGIVLALAGAGADVFIHYGKSSEAAEATAAQAEGHGVRAVIGSADLSDPAAARGLVDAATRALGNVRILVNSASGFPTDTLEEVTLGDWEASIRLTLTSPVFLTQAFARSLPEGADGAVVNVTDWRTARPYPDHFSYSVAKGAVDAFTRAAAVALAPHIRVNAVALGAILPPPGEDSAYLKRLAGGLPLRRVGSVEEVGKAVVALIAGDFITGEIVRVDGGAHLS